MSQTETSNSESNNVFYAEESPSGYVGETDRASGEYHHKSGYTQKIYTDASFSPADETTHPPRYYSPENVNKRRTRKKITIGKSIKITALCLVCALAGGLFGAAAVGTGLSRKITQLQEQVDNIPVLHESQQVAESQHSAQEENGINIAEIYETACQQTVGITTDITYTNFFGMTSSSAVSGTGFVVTETGYIITNYHVVEQAYKGKYNIRVMFHDGTTYDAAIVGFEDSNDIAVLKIDATGLKPVSFGNSDNLRVGDEAYAVGNPLGELDFTMSFGRISALDRLIDVEDNAEPINMFQLDVAVNSGNSGGPVYDVNGNVIGIVTAKYNKDGVEGLGFAIPVNDAIKIANDLIVKGYVTGKAYLGVTIDERYNSLYSKYYNMPLGAYIYSVAEGSSADEAGIQQGDIIVYVGDSRIESLSELKHALRQYHAGDSAVIQVYRSAEIIEVSIVFDEDQTSGGNGV